MSGFDLHFCDMPLPDTGLGPETLFCTRAFDGVFSDVYSHSSNGMSLDLSIRNAAQNSVQLLMRSAFQDRRHRSTVRKWDLAGGL